MPRRRKALAAGANRALYEGHRVTILERGRITTLIRNQYGYQEKVKTKDLEAVPDGQ